MIYNVIAIIGPAGSGKDTLFNYLKENYKNKYHYIKNCTSRPQRDKNDTNYKFVSRKEFAEMVLQDAFIEVTVFNNWFYGTELSELSKDKINIGVFNPYSLLMLADNKQINLQIIYISCSDKTRMLRQLMRENNPNIKEIIRRYSADEKDFKDLNKIYNLNFYINEDKKHLYNFVRFIDSLDQNEQYY